MKEQMPLLGSMRSRLLVSHIGVSIIATVVLFVTVRATAPSFFDHHVGNMTMMTGPAVPR